MPVRWASPPCSRWHRDARRGGSSRRMAAHARVTDGGGRAEIWRASNRRYLKPDFRCLRCKRGRPWASARTRYLKHCPRGPGSGVTHLTSVDPLLADGFGCRVPPVLPSSDMSTPQRPWSSPLLREGLQITAVRRSPVTSSMCLRHARITGWTATPQLRAGHGSGTLPGELLAASPEAYSG